MEDNVQYRTARIDNSEHTVDIKSVYKEYLQDNSFRSKHTFRCPCCDLEMEAVLGEIREKHFRHKGEPCGYNNYLHSTAEDVFFDEYTACLEKVRPFTIAVFPEIQCDPACTITKKTDCPKRNKGKNIIDLTQKYKRITPEKRFTGADTWTIRDPTALRSVKVKKTKTG